MKKASEKKMKKALRAVAPRPSSRTSQIAIVRRHGSQLIDLITDATGEKQRARCAQLQLWNSGTLVLA
jgi:hypothetical protein